RLPGVEVLFVGAHCRLRVEKARRERVGEFAAAALQVIEVGVVGEQIEDENLHGVTSCTSRRSTRAPRNANKPVAAAAMIAKPQALKKICRGGRPSDNSQPPSAG